MNCSSTIKYHWSQISIANIVIMKNSEIVQGLPKCDTETRNEPMLLEKNSINRLACYRVAASIQFILKKKKKNTVSVKYNILHHDKMKCPCSFLSLVTCPAQNLRDALAQPVSHENTCACTYHVLLHYHACRLHLRTVLIPLILFIFCGRI